MSKYIIYFQAPSLEAFDAAYPLLVDSPHVDHVGPSRDSSGEAQEDFLVNLLVRSEAEATAFQNGTYVLGAARALSDGGGVFFGEPPETPIQNFFGE